MQLINIVALVATAITGVYATLVINTPPVLVECQPALITWSGGQPPYFISVLPGGQVGATPIEVFGQQLGTSLTWDVDIAAGTSITLEIKDSSGTGTTGFTAPITIQTGNSSCVGKNSS